jgi:SsrA-binding protein
MSAASRDTSKPEVERLVAQNRKALHDYEILDRFEAGIALVGTEVKALRDGKCNLTGAFARIEGEEVFLHGMEIAEYVYGNVLNHIPKRSRKLLLHRHQIRKLDQQSRLKGHTLVPLRIYFKGAKAKVEVAVGRGRAVHDKRQAKAEQEARREIERDRSAAARRGGRRAD